MKAGRGFGLSLRRDRDPTKSGESRSESRHQMKGMPANSNHTAYGQEIFIGEVEVRSRRGERESELLGGVIYSPQGYMGTGDWMGGGPEGRSRRCLLLLGLI